MTTMGKLMKRVLFIFFCLLVIPNVFAAESDDLKVSLTVKKYHEVAFTKDPYASGDLSSMEGPVVDLGEITGAGGGKSSTTFYASAKTNWSTPFKMTIYGTALTRKGDSSSFDSNHTIPLTVSVISNEANAGETTPSEKFETAWDGTPTRGENSYSSPAITLIEGASTEHPDGNANASARCLTWALQASVADVDALEGSYEAYLWLEVEPGQL